MVNCDDCSVTNATITRAGEWGLDIVQGSDDFFADSNSIALSRWGGSVFDGVNNTNGLYVDNVFTNNNTGGYGPYCNGINYSGSASSFVATGSTGGGTLLCKPWP